MQNLSVTLIQTDLVWEDIPRNLEHFDHLFNGLTVPTDLILLPETFNSGFSINPATCSETMDGPSMHFLRTQARKKNAVIMTTLLISEANDCFNRLVCMYPDGHYLQYDKRHLFRLSEEYKLFKGGDRQVIVEVKEWKIAVIICYDLRFPVWCKNTYTEGCYGYDMLVCLANWPASRAHIWKSLLMARAIENQACVAGINRIGNDGFGTWHSGNTMALDAKGNTVYEAPEGLAAIKTLVFSGDDLKLFRESFTVGMDWDQFKINI